MRRSLGTAAAIASGLLVGWLALVLATLAAPPPALFGQSGIRLLAEACVLSLLLAAVGFWDD